jgi:hypothetical protein
MKILSSILTAAVVLLPLGTMPAQANDKRPSLPTAVLNAKTVYVDNQTTTADLQDTVYTELAKWGRLQIVDTPQKADIVLRLSNGNYVKFVEGSTAAPASDAKASNGSAPQNVLTPVSEKSSGADTEVPPGSTRISVIDPKSNNSLWSDVRKTNNPKVATHLLDGLREAFDQKEKAHGTK